MQRESSFGENRQFNEGEAELNRATVSFKQEELKFLRDMDDHEDVDYLEKQDLDYWVGRYLDDFFKKFFQKLQRSGSVKEWVDHDSTMEQTQAEAGFDRLIDEIGCTREDVVRWCSGQTSSEADKQRRAELLKKLFIGLQKTSNPEDLLKIDNATQQENEE